MKPPDSLDPLFDKKNGVTVLSKLNEEVWRSHYAIEPRRENILLSWRTMERDGRLATRALYRIVGFCCPIIAWFDPETLERLD